MLFYVYVYIYIVVANDMSKQCGFSHIGCNINNGYFGHSGFSDFCRRISNEMLRIQLLREMCLNLLCCKYYRRQLQSW